MTHPYGAFNFLVEIDGINVAGFSEVSGLEITIDVIEYREGGDQATSPRKLPGLHKFTNITLKRGYSEATELWDWMKTVLDGQMQRRSGSISLLNEARDIVVRWNFHGAWPSKLLGPSLDAGTSAVAIETLEITCESLVREPL